VYKHFSLYNNPAMSSSQPGGLVIPIIFSFFITFATLPIFLYFGTPHIHIVGPSWLQRNVSACEFAHPVGEGTMKLWDASQWPSTV
jgi:hypothetical protein